MFLFESLTADHIAKVYQTFKRLMNYFTCLIRATEYRSQFHCTIALLDLRKSLRKQEEGDPFYLK